jgi:hypothetical protein
MPILVTHVSGSHAPNVSMQTAGQRFKLDPDR